MYAAAIRAVLATVTTLSAMLLVSAGAGEHTRSERVELEVLGIVPLESEPASMLVLREKGRDTLLPIFVGRSEGAAIEVRLKRSPSAAPGAADLLEHAISALGAKVLSVQIEPAHDAVFQARVTLAHGGKHYEITGRPSDSIALAVSSRAPIFTTRDVMEEAGLTKKDLERLSPPPGSSPGAPGPHGDAVSF